jgi:hypothetical protein
MGVIDILFLGIYYPFVAALKSASLLAVTKECLTNSGVTPDRFGVIWERSDRDTRFVHSKPGKFRVGQLNYGLDAWKLRKPSCFVAGKLNIYDLRCLKPRQIQGSSNTKAGEYELVTVQQFKGRT